MARKPQHHGRTKYKLRDPGAMARWIDARARHRPWMPNARTAWSPYKTAALRALHAMTLTCERCGFLVPWVSAKRQAARRRKRTKECRIRKGQRRRVHGPLQEEVVQEHAIRGVAIRVGARAAERHARTRGVSEDGGRHERVEGGTRDDARGGKRSAGKVRQRRAAWESPRGS